MDSKMFCFQCQEASRGTGCTVKGVCGKDDVTSAEMDLLLFVLRGVAIAASRLRQVNIVQPQMGKSFVVHGRRHAVTNRGRNQANQLGVSGNTFCHDKILNMLEMEFLSIRGCREPPYLRGYPARCALRARHQ